jgi:DNA-binding response OmpR family regulator
MSESRLLVLDDDATVAQIVVLGAQGAGASARWCADPAAFFAALDDWQPTHLAIDLNLGTSSGQAVLEELARRRCSACVIVTSGDGLAAINAAVARGQALGLKMGGALPKPFALAQLRALL